MSGTEATGWAPNPYSVPTSGPSSVRMSWPSAVTTKGAAPAASMPLRKSRLFMVFPSRTDLAPERSVEQLLLDGDFCSRFWPRVIRNQRDRNDRFPVPPMPMGVSGTHDVIAKQIHRQAQPEAPVRTIPGREARNLE